MGLTGSKKAYWKVGNCPEGPPLGGLGFLDTFDANPSVSGPPYGNENVWSYYNGRRSGANEGDEDKWVKPVGEIKVKCLTFTNGQGKHKLLLL